MKSFKFITLILILVSMSGCSSLGRQLKSFLGGSSPKKQAVARTGPVAGSGPVHFSQRPDLTFNTKRKYKRTTKGTFEDQAKVRDEAGSLWNSDGQSAYLFSQNRLRKIGDLLNVRLKGAAKEQLSTKSKIIKRLLDKLEKERSIRSRIAAKRAENRRKSEKSKKKKSEENQQRSVASKKPGQDEFKVKEVPTRIVERLPDGNYRVKGAQAFMIGKREYKVIVTGIVRNEDFNEEGIDSGQILDPRYDIVGQRRSGSS